MPAPTRDPKHDAKKVFDQVKAVCNASPLLPSSDDFAAAYPDLAGEHLVRYVVLIGPISRNSNHIMVQGLKGLMNYPETGNQWFKKHPDYLKWEDANKAEIANYENNVKASAVSVHSSWNDKEQLLGQTVIEICDKTGYIELARFQENLQHLDKDGTPEENIIRSRMKLVLGMLRYELHEKNTPSVFYVDIMGADSPGSTFKYDVGTGSKALVLELGQNDGTRDLAPYLKRARKEAGFSHDYLLHTLLDTLATKLPDQKKKDKLTQDQKDAYELLNVLYYELGQDQLAPRYRKTLKLSVQQAILRASGAKAKEMGLSGAGVKFDSEEKMAICDAIINSCRFNQKPTWEELALEVNAASVNYTRTPKQCSDWTRVNRALLVRKIVWEGEDPLRFFDHADVRVEVIRVAEIVKDEIKKAGCKYYDSDSDEDDVTADEGCDSAAGAKEDVDFSNGNSTDSMSIEDL